jgi:hypothetical protein
MLTLLINETKPLAGLFASTTGGIGSVPDISVADEGQAVSVQTFTRTAGVITDSFVAGDVLHIGIGDGVNAPVCYIELSSASSATGTMAINTVGMVALFAATSANQLTLNVGVVRTRGGNTNTIFSAPIVIHRSVIDPDTAVPTPSILGTGVAAALLVAINTALGFVRLDASARLPAVDGSQLTNVPNELPSQTGNIGKYLTTNGTAASWATVSSVSDGDKGDITVSNSGATWTIDNDTITLAKLAHMPTARVLGRTTAGTGTPELLTISGTGSVAMTTSPSFTTPALGTPSAIVLTNASGTAASLTAGNATLAATATTALALTTTSGPTVLVAGAIADGEYLRRSGSTIISGAPSGSGTVTSVAQSFTGGLISVAGSPITASGTLALTVAGTSGGIPYFSSGTTWATSAALAASALVVGGGAGAAPATVTTGANVLTALGVAVGSAGAFITFNGNAGTPSAIVLTNASGTASININGTVGATTPDTAAFTEVTVGDTLVVGTAPNVGVINVRDASGNIKASIDGAAGTASFLNGDFVITNSPSKQVNASNVQLYIDTVLADNGLWIYDGVNILASLDYDGTAQFKTGAITLGKNTGTAAYIHSDGTSRLLSIELGHATDTTLERVSAGVVSIEGATILVNGGNAGTPSAIVLTNASGTAASLTAGNVTTNANLTGHVTSTGNAAVLGSFTMAQLSTAVSDGDPAYVGAANTFTTGQTISSTTSLLLGTAGSAVGTIGFNNATSGTTTLQPATGALGTGTVTLPLTGTLATLAGTETLTNKRITQRSGTATSSATPTINTDNVDFYSLTAQAADITSFTTNLSGTPTEGQTLWIAITGTAARAITWGATFEAGAVALPTTTVSTDRLDVAFVWNTVSLKWRCMASG